MHTGAMGLSTSAVGDTNTCRLCGRQKPIWAWCACIPQAYIDEVFRREQNAARDYEPMPLPVPLMGEWVYRDRVDGHRVVLSVRNMFFYGQMPDWRNDRAPSGWEPMGDQKEW